MKALILILALALLTGCVQDGSTRIGPDTDPILPSEQDLTLELVGLLDARDTTSYLATYAYESMFFLEQDVPPLIGEWTIHHAASDRLRIDTAYGAFGEQSKKSAYYINGILTTCVIEQDATTCTTAPEPEPGAEPSVTDIQAHPERFVTTRLDDRTILTTTTRCYFAVNEQDGVNLTYCFTDDPIPLLILTQEIEHRATLLATSYQIGLQNDAFIIPN